MGGWCSRRTRHSTSWRGGERKRWSAAVRSSRPSAGRLHCGGVGNAHALKALANSKCLRARQRDRGADHRKRFGSTQVDGKSLDDDVRRAQSPGGEEVVPHIFTRKYGTGAPIGSSQGRQIAVSTAKSIGRSRRSGERVIGAVVCRCRKDPRARSAEIVRYGRKLQAFASSFPEPVAARRITLGLTPNTRRKLPALGVMLTTRERRARRIQPRARKDRATPRPGRLRCAAAAESGRRRHAQKRAAIRARRRDRYRAPPVVLPLVG